MNLTLKSLALALLFVGSMTASQETLHTISVDGVEFLCPAGDSVLDCYPRIFRPSNEFQTVRQGQQLEPGLHVRVNLATGEKEARLMPRGTKASSENELALIPVRMEEESQPSSPITHESVPTPNTPVADSEPHRSKRRIPPGKIREYQAIVNRLACHIYQDARPHYDGPEEEPGYYDEISRDLTELEELAHHIDIGELLTLPLPTGDCKQDDVNVIVNLLSPIHALAAYFCDVNIVGNSTIRIQAARVIGAAVQNNPHVRDWVLQGEIPPLSPKDTTIHSLLSKILSLFCDHETDNSVRSSFLHVITNILRNNPKAWDEFDTRHFRCILSASEKGWNPSLFKRTLLFLVDLLDAGKLQFAMDLSNIGVSTIASQLSHHFFTFCLHPNGIYLDLCLITCEAVIKLAKWDRKLLETNVPLRDALELANAKWFSSDSTAICSESALMHYFKQPQCPSDSFEYLYDLMPSIAELIQLVSRVN